MMKLNCTETNRYGDEYIFKHVRAKPFNHITQNEPWFFLHQCFNKGLNQNLIYNDVGENIS